MNILKGSLIVVIIAFLYGFSVPTSAQLEKKWKLPQGQARVFADSLEFNTNGTLIIYSGGMDSTVNWTLTGNQITLTGSSMTFNQLDLDGTGKLNFNVSIGQGSAPVSFE